MVWASKDISLSGVGEIRGGSGGRLLHVGAGVDWPACSMVDGVDGDVGATGFIRYVVFSKNPELETAAGAKSVRTLASGSLFEGH
jgi:hypothetical protein